MRLLNCLIRPTAQSRQRSGMLTSQECFFWRWVGWGSVVWIISNLTIDDGATPWVDIDEKPCIRF